jgi:hypothetical protein
MVSNTIRGLPLMNIGFYVVKSSIHVDHHQKKTHKIEYIVWQNYRHFETAIGKEFL